MWVEKMKNGKFKAAERYEDYLTGKTKRVSVVIEKNTTQTRKNAQIALNAKIDAALSKHTDEKVTLRDLIEAYRADQKMTVKESTYTRNYFACDTILSILGEDILVNRLTSNYIRGKLAGTGKKAGTLNEHLKRFKALVRWGYRNDKIDNISFLDKIELFRDTPHKIKIQDKYLEADELNLVLENMKNEQWKLLTEFLSLSGLRYGEAAALKKTDVDLKANQIHITKTYDSVNRVVTTPKTLCSIRDVYIQPELKLVCKKVNAFTLRQSLSNGRTLGGLFFQDNSGGHLHYYSYCKYLKELCLRVTGKHITPHALRHTHASLLLENGLQIDIISRRLGHEGSKVTREVYLHVTAKLKEKDDKQLQNVKLL